MTIDEAIKHAEEVARTCDDSQCAKDHAQLADWLRELRRARMEIDLLKTLRDGFKADAQKYKAENAKLRELLLDCWDFSHLMHGSMASRYLELGLIGKDEARELGIEVEE